MRGYSYIHIRSQILINKHKNNEQGHPRGSPLRFPWHESKPILPGGVVNLPNAVFITHERALPSGPVNNSVPCPRGQLTFGVNLSAFSWFSPHSTAKKYTKLTKKKLLKFLDVV